MRRTTVLHPHIAWILIVLVMPCFSACNGQEPVERDVQGTPLGATKLGEEVNGRTSDEVPRPKSNETANRPRFRVREAGPHAPKLDPAQVTSLSKSFGVSLSFSSKSVFAGEPLYYSLVVTCNVSKFVPETTVPVFESRSASDRLDEYSDCFAQALNFDANKRASIAGIIYPKVRQGKDVLFLRDPGSYAIRSWHGWSNWPLAFSSQDVQIEVRSPTPKELRGLAVLDRTKDSLMKIGGVVLKESEVKEIEDYLASDPNAPLRDELQVVLAQQFEFYNDRAPDVDDEYVLRASRQIACCVGVSRDKPWLRRLCAGDGSIFSRIPRDNKDRLNELDWKRLYDEWTECPPLLPQGTEETRERFEKGMLAIKSYLASRDNIHLKE